eukprot:gb/GECG01008053.1/.p1 GENE.gb/GECG01008053.1/~~gb/GECG01008053.1/.p1  ORF type:complete len:136 (+),score=20.21 gb/GECG01008053.1/:1-408(+)
MTKIRGINKTDSSTLMSEFSNLAGVSGADPDSLSQCPGFGDKKVQNVLSAMHKPFSSSGPSNIQRRKVGMESVNQWRSRSQRSSRNEAYDPKEDEDYRPSSVADQRGSEDHRSTPHAYEDITSSNAAEKEVIELA